MSSAYSKRVELVDPNLMILQTSLLNASTILFNYILKNVWAEIITLLYADCLNLENIVQTMMQSCNKTFHQYHRLIIYAGGQGEQQNQTLIVDQ